MFEFYTVKAWDFDTKNLLDIRRELNEREKKNYVLGSKHINIEDYLEQCILAARRYILNEPDELLPRARRTMKM